MSVQLGSIGRVEVWAADYDADCIRLEHETESTYVTLYLDRKELQELSKIIDRFLS